LIIQLLAAYTVLWSESESAFCYETIIYCHRQSGSKAYRLQARPAPTGPGLRLTSAPRPDLPFNGRWCGGLKKYRVRSLFRNLDFQKLASLQLQFRKRF